MAKLECAICGHAKEAEKMRVFETTDAERAQLKRMGEAEPKKQYAYCRQCVTIMSNPATATSYMKGLAQLRAQSQGVTPDAAEKAASEFANRLLQKGAKPTV